MPSPFEPKTPATEADPQGGAIARFVQTVSDTGAAAWRDNVGAGPDHDAFGDAMLAGGDEGRDRRRLGPV